MFISYETQDGLRLALTAKGIFTDAGIDAWVWAVDKTIGEYTRREIAQQMKDREYFVYICTEGSDKSDPQAWERETAVSVFRKRPRVISFDLAHVSDELRAHNCTVIAPGDFEMECRRLAEDIVKQVAAPGPPKPDVREDQSL